MSGKQKLAKYRSFSHTLRSSKYHAVFENRFWQPSNYRTIVGYGKKISSTPRGLFAWIISIGEWVKSLIPNFRSRKQLRLDMQFKADQDMLELHKKTNLHNREANQMARRQTQRRK